MKIKTIKSDAKVVQIFRHKNSSGKYDYYLYLLCNGIFGTWYINDSYKQEKDINSLRQAIETANKWLLL